VSGRGYRSAGGFPRRGNPRRSEAGAGQQKDRAVSPLGRPRLYFTTVPEPKAAKNRVRLDLLPPGGEPRDELARLLGLGAVIAADQPPGAGWMVLTDPEGNEFCLEGGEEGA
jgi:glyoxalase superfamily protein